jgi:hypothetical protein
MPKTNWLRDQIYHLHPASIVITSVIVGILIGLGIMVWDIVTASNARTVENLSSPPVAAAHFYGVELPGFYYSIPYIETAEQAIYYWHLEEWLFSEELPENLDDSEICTSGQQKSIEKLAGALVDCLVVQEGGEQCPGPTVIYAIDGSGDVWKSNGPKPCINVDIWFTCVLSIVCGVVGVFSSFFFVISRSLIRWLMRL